MCIYVRFAHSPHLLCWTNTFFTRLHAIIYDGVVATKLGKLPSNPRLVRDETAGQNVRGFCNFSHEFVVGFVAAGFIVASEFCDSASFASFASLQAPFSYGRAVWVLKKSNKRLWGIFGRERVAVESRRKVESSQP